MTTLHRWAAVFLLPCGLAAAEIPVVAPEDVGLSARLLDAGVGLFADAVERDEVKGAVLLVAKDGKIALHEAVGWADPETDRKLRPDALFRMASNTKAVVSAAAMILVDEGKLSVDDPVRKYLPAFNNYRSGRITVDHLMTHTSGFRITPIFLSPLSKNPTLQKEVAKFGEIGAEREPGTSYSYNNPGYNTLGAVVEVVSGRPLDEFIEERIYRPLGMRESNHHESTADQSRMSAVYRYDEGSWRRGWAPGDDASFPFVRASGGMISSAKDFLRFCLMMLGGGELEGVRVLSEESVRQATAPQTMEIYSEAELAERESFYGYGWAVDRDGVYSHGGSDGTWAWVDPERKIVGLVFTQSSGQWKDGAQNLREQFQAVVNAAAVRP